MSVGEERVGDGGVVLTAISTGPFQQASRRFGYLLAIPELLEHLGAAFGSMRVCT